MPSKKIQKVLSIKRPHLASNTTSKLLRYMSDDSPIGSALQGLIFDESMPEIKERQRKLEDHIGKIVNQIMRPEPERQEPEKKAQTNQAEKCSSSRGLSDIGLCNKKSKLSHYSVSSTECSVPSAYTISGPPGKTRPTMNSVII